MTTNDNRNESIVYACASTYFVMDICGLGIALMTDWKKAAKEIRDGFQLEGDGQAMVGH